MRLMILAAIVVAVSPNSASAGPVQAVSTGLAPDRSPRPAFRPFNAEENVATVISADQSVTFDQWITDFKNRADRAGIDVGILDQAFAQVRYDPEVIRRDRRQSEFTKTIWDYLDTAVSGARIANGTAALNNNLGVLKEIEAAYGVEKEIIVAIWGLESAYGGFRGTHSVITSLATLAYDTRRPDFFEGQLMAALAILQNGDVRAAGMTGSWAGAMGHTQFMPTSFLDHAVDFNGDGKRDIWSDDPRDALASTAAYLKHFGWTYGQPWGVEVRIPDGFEYTLANRDITKLPSEWAALGVVTMDGAAVPDHGRASVLLPAGNLGAAFLIFENFEVLENYNTADAYVIGVGHLADRIGGGPAIQSGWPRSDRALTLDERLELQTRLTAAGFDTVKIDGKIGPLTINAVRAYQVASGLIPDGYASPGLLERLR